MRARLGRKQLKLLSALGSPTLVLVTPDRVSAGLVRRRLLRSLANGACGITPAGLRALADAIDAGELRSSLDVDHT